MPRSIIAGCACRLWSSIFLPFIFLFGGVFCLLRLSESRELVVIRAAGISAWQYLTPLLLTALFLGIAIIATLDPLGSRGLQKFLRH